MVAQGGGSVVGKSGSHERENANEHCRARINAKRMDCLYSQWEMVIRVPAFPATVALPQIVRYRIHCIRVAG
jgi:hypothetical protein